MIALPVIRQDQEPGDGDRDAEPYLRDLHVRLQPGRRPIQFSRNAHEPIHRWSPYVQGFSAEFVRATLAKYWAEYRLDAPDAALVHDPFAGSGTVLVAAKRLGVRRCGGTELNPLLAFLANTKLAHWTLAAHLPMKGLADLDRRAWHPAPAFLQSDRQFDPPVLEQLQILRGALERVAPPLRDLFLLAFAAILVDCSRLRRSPCLGYAPGKRIAPEAPWQLMAAKIEQIAADLADLQRRPRAPFHNNVFAHVAAADARHFQPDPVSLAITSPPYMNGLDYVMNYKIEMGWLGFTQSRRDAKELKDALVACDNVSLRLTADFARRPDRYREPWVEDIVARIAEQVAGWDERQVARRIPRRRKSPPVAAAQPLEGGGVKPRAYRRPDMATIVAKYFDDMRQVMARVAAALLPGGRFVLVVGDSLIADVYVPTDLVLAKMGRQLGLEIESIAKARQRRSGQIRSYRLRESIVTLRKPALE